MRSKVRDTLVFHVKSHYDTMDSGVSNLISALQDLRDYVIVLFDDGVIKGAASYYISKLHCNMEIDHIGVIDRNKGYGKKLMCKIFEIANELKRSTVSLVTNGYSNEFYERIGMVRVNNKLPAVYEKRIYLNLV